MHTLSVITNGKKLELATGTAVELIDRLLDGWENLFCDEDAEHGAFDVFAFTGARSEVFAIEPVKGE